MHTLWYVMHILMYFVQVSNDIYLSEPCRPRAPITDRPEIWMVPAAAPVLPSCRRCLPNGVATSPVYYLLSSRWAGGHRELYNYQTYSRLCIDIPTCVAGTENMYVVEVLEGTYLT